MLKLLITVFSTVILLIYMSTLREIAGLAADPVANLADVRNPSPVIHAILALILLVGATLLGSLLAVWHDSLRKGEARPPRRVCWRQPAMDGMTRWGYFASWAVVGIGLLLILVHWMQTGFQH